MDPVITQVDVGGLLAGDAKYEDDTLTFAGADTYVAGTILARDSSSANLIAFVKGGDTNENGIPKAVLPYDVEVTGAGNVKIRSLVQGLLHRDKLVIDADGDDSNVDAPVLDQLRSYGILTQEETELQIPDNS